MKKIKYLFLITLISLLPTLVFASSGKITISSSSQVVLGNKVTVTVKLSDGASWEMDLNYDKNYLQLVSGGGEASGTNMVNTSTGKPNRTYTFTFKTLKAGNTTVKIGSYYVVDDNFGTMSINASSKTIKIITQAELEASYSKDNNLKSLAVDGYDLTPSFSKDILDYSVDVPEGTKSVKINATPNDSKSDVSGIGEIEVSEGTNNVVVLVKAENGSEKKYNITINVIDTNPINVTIDGMEYTVVKLRNNFTCPSYFEETEVNINDISVPACQNDAISYMLIGLKDSDGNIKSYVYNPEKTDKYYSLYSFAYSNDLKIIITGEKEFENGEKTTITIEDNDYPAYKYGTSGRYFIVYGKNIETGEDNFYLYDSKNNTFSSYDEELLIKQLKEEEQNDIYKYVILTFGTGLFLAIICIICLSIQKKKIKKHLIEYTKKEDNSEKKKNNK